MDEISEFRSPLNYSDRNMWIPETIKHPAKAHLGMLKAIILEYTNEGDTILDPMAGIGSTLILGMLHNRKVIGVEYEGKFCKTIRVNIELNRKPRLLPLGHAEIIQGDARLLSRMFKDKADGVVMSPPYAESAHDPSLSEETIKRTEESQGRKYTRKSFTGAHEYSKDKANIGNLPFKVDVILTSPPYAGSKKGKPNVEKFAKEMEKHYTKDWDGGKDRHTPGRMRGTEALCGGYSDDKSNIGNLPFKADSIITSPPYEEGGGHGGKPTKVAIEKRQSSMGQGTEELYSSDKDNIGNLKGQTYLEAMKMVYQGCYDVLKENGIMVPITKNFIRNKKIIPLDQHTIQLCESVGFTFVKRHYRKITKQSFWRVLYKKKYGIEIPYEDILAFRKQRVIN